MNDILDAISIFKEAYNKDAEYLWLSEKYFKELDEDKMNEIMNICSSDNHKLELKIVNTLKDGFSIG